MLLVSVKSQMPECTEIYGAQSTDSAGVIFLYGAGKRTYAKIIISRQLIVK